jgi:GH15 family glucan-1,4-alpha-glucosidase
MTIRSDARAPSGSVDLVAASLAVIDRWQAPSGAFIAGPTFSQYGYAWLRDGAFIAEGLDLVGDLDRARRFHDWVAQVILASEDGIERSIAAVRADVTPSPADYLHCRYDASGAIVPDDWPTFQLDGPGIWLWSLAHHARSGGQLQAAHRDAARLAARYLAALWPTPSYDAWEEYPDHLHTSTLAATLAGLRAVPAVLAGDDGLDGLDGLGEGIAEAERAITGRLFDRGRPFGKWDGNPAVDGSFLWMVSPYGLVAPHHPAFAATLRAIEADLVSVDGGVHRYAEDTYYGGGEWLLLTAALGRVYLQRGGPGDRERAQAALAWIEAQAGDGGSLPEQVGTRALHPERIDEWRRAWGEPACPLLWSHATYLALHAELHG